MATTAKTESAQEDQQAETVVSAMQPLQVLLGNWNGTSRRAILDQPQWVWDFQTNPAQPALLMESDKGEYIRKARLTFLPPDQQYQLAVTDADGVERVFRGTFTREVQDVIGDDKKPQRTYRLELTQVKPEPSDETWRIALNQQQNDRYLLEVDRRRGGGAFVRVDTVNTLREGTSFALSDTDYGDKTCIISQGLGVMQVSYKGKSYWVCCSGCKAAFEEDPERWLAKLEQREQREKK